MTQYELWTLDGRLLVQAYRNACIGCANGRKTAERAMEILGGEIMRRLNILKQMDEDEQDNMDFYYNHPEGVTLDEE